METPFSLRMTADILPQIDIPTGPFNPAVAWEHQYAMWIVVTGPSGKSHQAGTLTLTRTCGPAPRLDVDQTTHLTGQRSLRTWGSTNISGNRLSTPLSWRLESQLFLQANALPETHVEISGQWRAGTVSLHSSSNKRVLKTNRQMSACWTLFDAVQRLGTLAAPVRFDLLEEMELLRPGHLLTTAEPAEARINGQTVPLRRYEQTGAGILPTTYWLDAYDRLIMVYAGVRAFILTAGGNR